jgi:hypothetical protein
MPLTKAAKHDLCSRSIAEQSYFPNPILSSNWSCLANSQGVIARLGVTSQVDAINARMQKPSFANVNKQLQTWGKKMEPCSWSSPYMAIANESLLPLEEQIRRDAINAATGR